MLSEITHQYQWRRIDARILKRAVGMLIESNPRWVNSPGDVAVFLQSKVSEEHCSKKTMIYFSIFSFYAIHMWKVSQKWGNIGKLVTCFRFWVSHEVRSLTGVLDSVHFLLLQKWKKVQTKLPCDNCVQQNSVSSLYAAVVLYWSSCCYGVCKCKGNSYRS